MNRTSAEYMHLACLLAHDIRVMALADPENEALERLNLILEHLLENPAAAENRFNSTFVISSHKYWAKAREENPHHIPSTLDWIDKNG